MELEKNKMDNLQAVFTQLKSFVDELEIASLLPQVNSVGEILKTNKIYIAVLGRFKAGKSSFLNSLIGRDILPTGVLPVTAILTSLQYDATNCTQVHFSNGRIQNISEDELSEFVTEKKNPINQKHIQEVKIYDPSLLKYNGLVFVDTPGLGSTFIHNSQMTMASLPKVQLALMCVGVDPPLSEQDLALIKETMHFTSDIVILVTKADLVTENDQADIKSFIDSETQKTFGKSYPIYFYSIRDQFGRLRSEFDSQVLAHLLTSKDEVHSRIASYKMMVLKSDLIQYLNLREAVLENKNSQAKRITEGVLHEETQAEYLKREIGSIKRTFVTDTREILLKDLSTGFPDILKSITEKLQTRLSENNVSLWKMTRIFEDFLEENIKLEMNSLIASHEKTGRDYLASVQMSFNRLVEAFRNRISQTLKDSFNIDFKLSMPEIQIELPEVYFIPFPKAFDTQIDLLSFLIPMGLFRQFFIRHFVKSVNYEIEKNISRLASSWTEAINLAVEALAKQTQLQISLESKSLKNILRSEIMDDTNIEASLRALKEIKL